MLREPQVMSKSLGGSRTLPGKGCSYFAGLQEIRSVLIKIGSRKYYQLSLQGQSLIGSL